MEWHIVNLRRVCGSVCFFFGGGGGARMCGAWFYRAWPGCARHLQPPLPHSPAPRRPEHPSELGLQQWPAAESAALSSGAMQQRGGASRKRRVHAPSECGHWRQVLYCVVRSSGWLTAAERPRAGMLGKLPLDGCAATCVVEECACLLHMRWSRWHAARQSIASENVDVGSPSVDSAKASKSGGRVCPP